MTTSKTTPSQPIGHTPTKEKTFGSIVATIIINEIMPRCKKYKLRIVDFPPMFVQLLIALEILGKIDRKRTREFLEEHAQWVAPQRVILKKPPGIDYQADSGYHEMFGLKYRNIMPTPIPKKAHAFEGNYPYRCIKCNFKTYDVSDLRKGNCNMFPYLKGRSND